MRKIPPKLSSARFRTWIEIDRQALKYNVSLFKKIIGRHCRLMAVVKSNAYGHDLRLFSSLVKQFNVDWLGVDSITEAMSLRKAGISGPILVLGYTLPNYYYDAQKNNISLTIADPDSLNQIKKISRHNLPPAIHLKIDTGMHRQGFNLAELPKAIKLLKNNSGALIEGVYTHFAAAKNPAFPQTTLAQLNQFHQAVKLLESAGFNKIIKHTAATAGTILFPESRLDMVRIGIGLYGFWPSKETEEAFRDKLNLQPVLSWKTIICQIKSLPKGSKIGYDLTETLDRDSRVAVLPIGYWHGYPRFLSSIGHVLINGQSAKVLGRISMDMVSIDITDIKKAKVGDQVTLIGQSGLSKVTADDLAELCQTTNYEIITRLNPLIRRNAL